MRRSGGFIQIPVIVIVFIIALIGGAGYVALEAVDSPQQGELPEEFEMTEPIETSIESTSQNISDEVREELTPVKVVPAKKTTVPEIIADPVSAFDAPKVKIITLPTGAIVETDLDGNILRTIQEAVQQVYISPVVATLTTEDGAAEIEILSVNITTTTNSAMIAWQTNVPTESKAFVAGGASPPTPYRSLSGLSTRHVVTISGLESGVSYNYELESIFGNRAERQSGTFTTAPDEYTLSVVPNKTSVSASGWDYVLIKVQTLKNGEPQKGESVYMTASDSGQNETRSISNQTTPGAGDWQNTFTYYPKSVDTHVLNFTWRGIVKSVVIQASQYAEPTLTAKFFYAPRSIEVNRTHYIGVEISGQYEGTTFTNPVVTYNIISGNFTIDQLRPYITSAGAPVINDPNNLYLNTHFERGAPFPGSFKLEITSITLTGVQSGLYHTVDNLPIQTPYIEITAGETDEDNIIQWP